MIKTNLVADGADDRDIVFPFLLTGVSRRGRRSGPLGHHVHVHWGRLPHHARSHHVPWGRNPWMPHVRRPPHTHHPRIWAGHLRMLQMIARMRHLAAWMRHLGAWMRHLAAWMRHLSTRMRHLIRRVRYLIGRMRHLVGWMWDLRAGMCYLVWWMWQLLGGYVHLRVWWVGWLVWGRVVGCWGGGGRIVNISLLLNFLSARGGSVHLGRTHEVRRRGAGLDAGRSFDVRGHGRIGWRVGLRVGLSVPHLGWRLGLGGRLWARVRFNGLSNTRLHNKVHIGMLHHVIPSLHLLLLIS